MSERPALPPRVANPRGEEPPPISFVDEADALDALAARMLDETERAELRRALAEEGALDLGRLGNDQLLRWSAGLVARAELTILTPPRLPPLVRVEAIAQPVEATPRVKPAETRREETRPATVTWIEIELTDASNRPMQGVRYVIKLPDGTPREGQLDAKGRARVDGIPAGDCEVSFPDLHGEDWEAA